MEKVAGVLTSTFEGSVRFTSLDMQYAYGQTDRTPPKTAFFKLLAAKLRERTHSTRVFWPDNGAPRNAETHGQNPTQRTKYNVLHRTHPSGNQRK